MEKLNNTWALGDVHGSYKGLNQVFDKAKLVKGDTIISLGDIVDGYSQSAECVQLLLDMQKDYNMIFIRGNHDCLDEETEVFTSRGWLKYTNLLNSDEVLGINTTTNKSEWQSINEVIIKDSDHINYYSNNNLDFAMTDSHRIIHLDSSNKYSYTHLDNIKYTDRLNIPLSCETSNLEYDISDNLIKLTAWILTDGSISKKGYVTIYQSKINNLEYINELLEALNLEFTVYKRNKPKDFKILGKSVKSTLEANEFRLVAKSSKYITTNLINDKRVIPSWCYQLSQRQLNVLLNEVIRGDGSWYRGSKNTAILYGTYQFLSNIQPLFNICGYSANISKTNRGDFRLNISKKQTSSIRQDITRIKRVVKDCKVWCLSVPNSNFLVRRNGKSYFTGNCWCFDWMRFGAKHNIWINQGGKSTFDSYDVNFHLRDTHCFEFFNKQVNYYIDDQNRGFVHGGYTSNEGLGHEDTQAEYYWNRDLMYTAMSGARSYALGNAELPKQLRAHKEIFIGHTSTVNWDTTSPINACNLWNLDTGAGWGGVLTLMNVDTKEFVQSDFSKDLYPLENGR